MNIDLNNLDEPRLTPPEVVYEHKASLKKTAVVPLYVKIASAAAAAALLLTLCWPRPNRPALELTAELKPLVAKWAVPRQGTSLVQEGQDLTFDRNAMETLSQHAESPDPQGTDVAQHPASVETEASHPAGGETPRRSVPRHDVSRPVRQELPLMAFLPPMPVTEQTWAEASGTVASTDDVLLSPSTLTDLAQAWTPEGMLWDQEAGMFAEQEVPGESEIELTNFGALLRQGWRTVKVELAQLNESVGASFRQLKQIPPPPSFHSDSDF